ncbi:hypothetical protein ACFSDD_10945 [Salipiger marinus]|uniref:hypothetical protein n=1 Tax=Salipiger marinus TaxID=555512 RepID=UPI002CE2ABA8|nr:hypothetical protein [Salipiger manganoxidans]MEB3419887.1 hypothetical protein [Salipiger manganoxidans]
MPYAPTIYDWRTNCVPLNQVFRAGGQSGDSGLTLGGVRVGNPEPGGRAELRMGFAAFVTEEANIDASWTISRIMNGAVMRVPVHDSVQLVSAAALSGPESGGLPWDNGEPWATGAYWEWNPTAPVTAAAARGATSVSADLGDYGQVLKIGHVVGFTVGAYDFAHAVMDISYDADDVATITVSPPLRRPLTTDHALKFRPRMLAVCANAASVMTTFVSGRHMTFGDAVFVEALV